MVGGFIDRADRKTSGDLTFFCPDVVPDLQDWQDLGPVGEYVFPEQAAIYLGSADKDGDCSPISREFSGWLRKLFKDSPDADKLGFNSLRKTAATMTAARTGDRAAASRLLGHGSQAITDKFYINPDKDQRRQLALAAANPLSNISDAELLAEIEKRNKPRMIN